MHETKMKILAKTDEVLETLRKNRETHSSIVKEARLGYVKAVEKKLEKTLEDVRSGKPVVLQLFLQPPEDHTKVYDTAIRMLEMHQNRHIELDDTQVRNLVMDRWDWQDRFLGTNAAYSQTAASLRSPDDDN